MKNILVILILSLFSCSQIKRDRVQKNDIAAIIDKDTVFISSIDKNIQNELYEELFSIYYFREIGLEIIIKEHLIKKEVKNNNLTRRQLIKNEIGNKLSENGLSDFIKNNGLQDYLIDSNNPLHRIDSNSEQGKKRIAKMYREYMFENYIHSLKKKYNVKSYLSPPLPPTKDLIGIEKHFHGNVQSVTNIVLASAFDCPECINFHPVYQRLYKKYKNRVKFGLIHLTPEVNLPIMTSEYAHQQGKFWEMYDLIYEQQPKDTTEYFHLAKQIGLDSVQLMSYLNNKTVKQNIQTNLEALMAEDIIRTPSILINDRLYYGGFSFEKISEYLDAELSKKE